jgi:hypothetical protein
MTVIYTFPKIKCLGSDEAKYLVRSLEGVRLLDVWMCVRTRIQVYIPEMLRVLP